MPSVLIVSPHFPPVSAPDMHRVRVSLPHFAEFGWRPTVLAVHHDDAGRPVDPLLLRTIPDNVPVTRVRAMPTSVTRKIGIGALGLRAWPALYRAGRALLSREPFDLVYFSTTAFPTMALGRAWKTRHGVPFVLDLQDPWVGDFYEGRPRREQPAKYRLARRMHSVLEAWTMRAVDGIVAVTAAYHERLRQKYPWIREDLCDTITFGASTLDFDAADGAGERNTYFRNGDGNVHGVAVGVLGRPKQQVCEALCIALREGLRERPDLYNKIRLHFIGTDYQTGPGAVSTIAPIAAAAGLSSMIQEESEPVRYFSGLRLLKDADFLLMLGSDDPHYTASKLYPYILTRKPLLAVFRDTSSVVDVLRATKAGEIVAFRAGEDASSIARSLARQWASLLERLPYEPPTDWDAFQPYTAREITRRQCALFDRVLARRLAGRDGQRLVEAGRAS